MILPQRRLTLANVIGWRRSSPPYKAGLSKKVLGWNVDEGGTGTSPKGDRHIQINPVLPNRRRSDSLLLYAIFSYENFKRNILAACRKVWNNDKI